MRRYFASQNFSAILDAKETGDYSAFILDDSTTPKNWGQLRKAILDSSDKKDNRNRNGNGNGNGNNKELLIYLRFVNSSRKCNRRMVKHLKGCFETKGFARSEIESGHGLLQRFMRKRLEVRFLWKILSEQAIGVFVGTALPGRIGMCEVELEMEKLSDLFVVCELFAVIGSQGMDLVPDWQ